MHHLNVMLDGTHQGIAIGEDTRFFVGEQTMMRKPLEDLQGGASAQIGILIAMRELQILNDKLRIANGTFAEFYFAPITSLLLQDLLGALLHRKDAGTHIFRRVTKDVWLSLRKDFFTEGDIARDGTRFEQRLFFPQARMSLNVLQIPFVRGDEETIPAPRTETHIDAIEETFWCDTTEVINESFAKFEFVDGVVRGDE